jgi:DNA mismatch repair protein MSH4
MKYETRRQFYIRIPKIQLTDRELPDIFTNVVKRKTYLECQTLTLLKYNQKVCDVLFTRIEAYPIQIKDCEVEIINSCQLKVIINLLEYQLNLILGEKTVEELTTNIIEHISSLYKCCESIALLDMVRSKTDCIEYSY